MNARRRPTTLLFDLDGTLYPVNHDYIRRVSAQVLEYMRSELKLENVKVLRRRLYTKFNQTLRGLRSEGFVIDGEKYWQTVRSGTKESLKPDKKVKNALASLTQRNKFVFTNCAEKEAMEALDALEISKDFDHVYGANWMGDCCKPDELAFWKVLQHSGVDPKDCAMFEDSYINLVQAKSLGMWTIFVSEGVENVERLDLSIFDAVVPALTENNLRTAAPWLWDD
eukprot:542334_1